MTCEETRGLLSAYQDGELQGDRLGQVESHLQTCAECAAILKRNLKLSEAIRSQAPSYAPSESLLRSTGQMAARRPAWKPFAGGVTVGLAASVAIMLFFSWRTSKDLTAELVSDHVRSLMASHIIDVVSSDRHTVKPWFLGKVPFAPTVPDLGPDGYPLLGGRLDYVGGEPAAALVYGKQKHVINVFVMPERGGGAAQLNGYNIEHWRIGDLGYWAVSDVTPEDLKAFGATFRQRGLR
jgi:anti-sigma factor RsiW